MSNRPSDLGTGEESGNCYFDETLPGGLHFRNSSRHVFSMYSKVTEAKDNEMVERWQKDAEGILIFAGLFSAVVAQLLSATVLGLNPSPPPQPQPQPQGNSEFYLKNICLALSQQNDSCQPPPSLIAHPPTSSSPTSAIWVNSLWFLSLVISLTCAMLATFIQRWACRYIEITQSPQYSPHKRARLRAFFSDGVDKWHVSWAVEALPTLLHLSLFLFFVGLVIYLFSTNHIVFGTVVWWVVLSMLAYLCITLLPIFRPNSPYYAPLSSIFWFFYICIYCAISKVISSPVFSRFGFNTMTRFRRPRNYYCKRFSEDIRKVAEETVLRQSPAIDLHVLESIFDSLGEDGSWERFFEAIPGFFDSELVTVILPNEFRHKFSQALSGFLDCTFSLSSVTESVRSDRLIICLNAAHAALGSEGVSQILQDILNERWTELSQSVEIGHALQRWRKTNEERFTPNVRRIVAQIVVDVRERDGRWFSLVKTEYAIAKHVLRDYIGHGDSVLLSILIHMTREAFNTGIWTPWILQSLSDFNALDTSPELRHAFCALWNDIVLEASQVQNEEWFINIPVQILREVRHVYNALHQGTDAALATPSVSPYHFHPDLDHPRSYRLCTVAGHRRSLSIHTRRTGSFNLPSVTQLDQTPAASPLNTSPTDSDHTHDGSTASQQGKGANIMVTVEPPSSTDDIPDRSYTRRFPSSPPDTNSVHTTRATPIAGYSVSGSTTDFFLVPGGASHDPRRSALSVPGIAATNSWRSDDTAPSIHTSELGETSQAFVTHLNFQHLDAVPAAITSSPGLDLGNPDALQAIPSYALEGNEIVVPCISPEINEMSSIVNPIPSIPHVPPAIVDSNSPSPPFPLSAPSGSVTALNSPSSVESAPVRPDHILQALQSLASSLATSTPQVASAFDVQITLRFGTPSPHDETREQNPPIPMTVLVHLAKAESPADDTVASTFQPDDQVQDDPDKS